MSRFFTNLGFWGRILAFIILLMASFLVAIILSGIAAVLICGRDAVAHQDVDALIVMQVVSSLCVFMGPALALCLVCREGRPMERICMGQRPGLMPVLISIGAFLVLMPFVSWLEEWNLGMTLPDSMRGIEDWMRASEQKAADITQKIVNTTSTGQMLINIFAIALVPAISEEMCFRVGLQRCIIDDTTRINPYVSAVIAAFVFSAIHLQFFGFAPRFVMGIALGLMLVITRSVWCSMITHFLNNAFAVVWAYMETCGRVEDVPRFFQHPVTVVVSLMLGVAMFVILHRIEKKS